jgi:hypothetical protein
MKDLAKRLQRLEAQHRRRAETAHFISVLFVPSYADQDECAAYLAEALACGCQPGCPGKRAGAVLPAKLSPEEWTRRAQAYYAERRAEHGNTS